MDVEIMEQIKQLEKDEAKSKKYLIDNDQP
jgi:hypothetical protein